MLINHCLHCSREIIDYGCIAENLYYLILMRYIEGKVLGIRDNTEYRDVLRFLENKGFIVTTEISVLALECHPCGVQVMEIDEDEGVFICCRKELHGN